MDLINGQDQFPFEDVDSIVKNSIANCLADAVYHTRKVVDWTNQIVDCCLRELAALNKQFKYVVTCTMMQKNGAGLKISATMHWDPSKDSFCQVPWENNNMHCIVTVYGCSLNIDDPVVDE